MREGNFLLEACPGSGKTRTIGQRAARISVDDTGLTVAAVSYTNVAVKEIRAAALSAGAPLAPPHFVGTLHRFLLRYVFYPFGSRVMGCAGPPRLRQETYRRDEVEKVWLPRPNPPVPISQFEFRADGRLVVSNVPVGVRMTAHELARYGQEQALELKRKVAAQGIATWNDAMYYAEQVLEQYPTVAAAVAARFDEMIVDEAQDTNDLQLRCLELLHASGQLASLVLVGDFDQAIYSFSHADPGKCMQFARSCGLQTLPLTENFRSSQAICDVTYRFSSRGQPDTARGAYRRLGVRPEILRYHPNELSDLIELYEDRLARVGIASENACVLVRTNSLADRLNGTQDANDSLVVRILGHAAALLDAGRQPDRVTVGTVQHLLGTFAWEDPVRRDLSAQQRNALRDQTIALLYSLPGLDRPMNDWITATREVITTVLGHLTQQPAVRPGHRLRTSANDHRTARAVFASGTPSTISTRLIHKAKGESHDAVLLVAARPSGGRDQARTWVSTSTDDETAEEIRIAYVALTRARRYLAVALPQACRQEVIDLYVDRGFHLVD